MVSPALAPQPGQDGFDIALDGLARIQTLTEREKGDLVKVRPLCASVRLDEPEKFQSSGLLSA